MQILGLHKIVDFLVHRSRYAGWTLCMQISPVRKMHQTLFSSTETPPSLFNVLVLNVAALMHFLIIGPFWFYMVIIWELVM